MFRRKSDILLKAAFEEFFPFLLRFFFVNADHVFDLDREFTFMDKELLELFPEYEKKGGSGEADLLVKVFLLDGTEQWILLHIEIQEQYKADFPKRMFRYYYRIYDRYDMGITAMAVFTGRQKPSENRFTQSLLGATVTYEYNTYHVLDHTEAELLEMANPFALVVLAAQKALLAEKAPEQELGDARLSIAKALVKSEQFTHKQIGYFLIFLKQFLYIKNKEINTIFDKQTEALTGKKFTMGILEAIKKIEREEGREEGIEQGIEKGIEQGIEKRNYEFVKKLLLETDFSTSKIATLVGVTAAFVNDVKNNIK